jgi:hypothetical protein
VGEESVLASEGLVSAGLVSAEAVSAEGVSALAMSAGSGDLAAVLQLARSQTAAVARPRMAEVGQAQVGRRRGIGLLEGAVSGQ